MKWNKTVTSWYHDKIIQLQDIVKLCYEQDFFCWIKFIIKVAKHNKWSSKKIDKWKSMIQTLTKKTETT